MGNTVGNRSYIRRVSIAVLLTLSLCGFMTVRTVSHAGAESEERAVLQAAQDYLDAEVRRDLPKVFACLAPSSAYRTTHDYEAYLAEAEASPVRIHGYKILGVKRIRGNHAPQAFPKVEKFAQVEVDIIVYYEDTNMKSEINFDFTFIKEGGRWYKG
jgi:hypothetical protein